MGAREKHRKKQQRIKEAKLMGKTILLIVRLAEDMRMVYEGSVVDIKGRLIGVRVASLRGKPIWLTSSGEKYIGLLQAGNKSFTISGHLQ